ncbi:hypothetical protein [Acinetobacter sp. MD2(2019)]|uniref:hypothetical protein n=1 Tax=Acinetobacter sp. MD2(2019) TaxID=2605273 RepID=UPI002D1EEEF0|nr:hypothetical protein [Acinetobacter sp. MD2(2019)]MEB3754305.1 hypothetical protein [Acinetobacter sp. MD2(2019)]
MPIQNKSIPKSYDAGDMLDMADIAHADMDWMSIAIEDLSVRLRQLKKDMTAYNVNAPYHFEVLEKVMQMYEYVADNRKHYHKQESAKYEALWEQEKGLKNGGEA